MSLKLEQTTETEWHLMKGNESFGPFHYQEIINMLQKKEAFHFDFVWAKHLDAWTRLANLPEFTPERIARIHEKNLGNESFLNRRFARFQGSWQALVTNDQSLWTAELQSVSEAGGLLLVETPILVPGDSLNIHLRSKDQFGGLNLESLVISKSVSQGRMSHNSRLHYAVSFETDLRQLPPVKNFIQFYNKVS